MTATRAELESAACTLASQIARRRGEDPDSWWMAELIRRSWSAEPQSISRSPFGFLVSVDTERSEVVRAAAQPGETCTAETLGRILAGAGAAGRAAATGLRAFGDGTASWRGAWQIGLGDAGGDVRVYAGPRAGGSMVPEMAGLRTRGWWPPRLEADAAEWLDRLRPSVELTGIARRFGTTVDYKAYMHPVVPLGAELVEYVALEESPSVRDELAEFLRMATAPEGGARPYTWSLGLTGEGGLADWKLELLYRHLDVRGLYGRWPALEPFESWAREVGVEAGVATRLAGVSFRAHRDGCGVVLYIAFEPVDARADGASPEQDGERP